jgi:hypothetical protein
VYLEPNKENLCQELRWFSDLVLIIISFSKGPLLPDYLFKLEHHNVTAEVLDNLQSNNRITIWPNQSFSINFKYNTKIVIENNFTLDKTLFLDNEIKKWKINEMNELNTKIGLLFASGPFMQLISAPFIGYLTQK